MNGYKHETMKHYSYKEKEKMYKEEKEEINFDELVLEKRSIENLCQGIAIQESLENLIYFTSNPDFVFDDKLPSQMITVIIDQIRQNQSENKTNSILCLQFIANIWNYPLFIEECLVELVTLKCFDSDLEIALYSIKSISNLIKSTTNEGSKNFGVDKGQLDQLLFPYDPSIKDVDLSKLHHLLSLLEVDSLDIVTSTLELILNITRVYKIKICSTIINNNRFVTLMNATETQNITISIICNLASDDECFDIIFTPDFANMFIKYAIDIKDPDTVFNMYTVLSHFPRKSFLDNLQNKDLWESIISRLKVLINCDLTNLLHFISDLTFIDPSFLDQYNFWPRIFEISEDFSVTNKVGFADILTSYFNKTINLSTQDLEKPPLCYAVNGGFEFLYEILHVTLNPLLFYNVSKCLTNLVITKQEVFGNIANDLHLIDDLRNMKNDIVLDTDNEEDKASKHKISEYITTFISIVSPFTFY